MSTHVALLRGINVGGRNLIKMPALRSCFEDGGFEAVRTYIQSGNVLFDARGSARELTDRLEHVLEATFGFEVRVVVRTRAQMRAVVAGAPAGFGTDPGSFRYDVVFLKAPLTAAAALRDLPMKEGVDAAFAGRGVLYLERLASRLTQSRLSRVASMPVYRDMTIRNWRTTTTIVELMGGR